MAKLSNPLDRFARDIAPGTLEWIGLRPQRRAPMLAVEQVMALEKRGLEGDHRCEKSPGSGRQVTLISREFMRQTAHFLSQEEIEPGLLNRSHARNPGIMDEDVDAADLVIEALRHILCCLWIGQITGDEAELAGSGREIPADGVDHLLALDVDDEERRRIAPKRNRDHGVVIEEGVERRHSRELGPLFEHVKVLDLGLVRKRARLSTDIGRYG